MFWVMISQQIFSSAVAGLEGASEIEQHSLLGHQVVEVVTS